MLTIEWLPVPDGGDGEVWADLGNGWRAQVGEDGRGTWGWVAARHGGPQVCGSARTREGTQAAAVRQVQSFGREAVR